MSVGKGGYGEIVIQHNSDLGICTSNIIYRCTHPDRSAAAKQSHRTGAYTWITLENTCTDKVQRISLFSVCMPEQQWQ